MDVDLIGWADVWLGGTYGCRCGILYSHMLGVVFYAGLVSLTTSYPSPCSPYSSERGWHTSELLLLSLITCTCVDSEFKFNVSTEISLAETLSVSSSDNRMLNITLTNVSQS